MNFAAAPDSVPVNDFIVATEKACRLIPEEERSQLWSEVNWFIEKCVTPNQNISKEERQTLKEIAKDKEIKVLPADKGKATVVMDKQWTRLRSMMHTKIDKTSCTYEN